MFYKIFIAVNKRLMCASIKGLLMIKSLNCPKVLYSYKEKIHAAFSVIIFETHFIKIKHKH